MSQRTVEIFSAGCPACKETIELVQKLACSSCSVTVLDMNDPQVAARARSLGIARVPAVVVDGKLAECCTKVAGPTEARLRAAGVGSPA